MHPSSLPGKRIPAVACAFDSNLPLCYSYSIVKNPTKVRRVTLLQADFVYNEKKRFTDELSKMDDDGKG